MTNVVSGLDSHVLILNKHYMAIRITDARRAFSLLARQLAEVIVCDAGQYSNYDFNSWIEVSEMHQQFNANAHDWVRTVKFSIAVPRIIRLLFYDRLPKRKVTLNRRNVYARDDNKCQYCGKRKPTSELSLDHVVPRRLGGETTWQNLVCACVDCNVRKGGRTPVQARMKLITKPIQPKKTPVLAFNFNQGRYRSWKQFLDHAYWSVELH